MNGIEAKASIAKLNTNNYQLWKFKLEMILARDDLWEIVHDDVPAAPDTTWNKRNRQAMATISLAVEDNQLIHIRKCETGKGMWEALKNLYERPNLNSKLYLLRKLYKMRLENHQSMTAHINNMLEIVEQLRGLGEELKEDHIAALILCSLPESYGPLITALEGRASSELTLELIKGKLMDEFHRRKENYGHENSTRESALKVDHSYERYKGRRDTRECFHCKKTGHIKRDCRALKAQIRSGQIVRTPHRVKAATKDITKNYNDTDNEQEREEDENYCFFTSEGHRANEWYVDSGATSHMTSERDFFTKLSLYSKPEKVLLADGSNIEVEGVGSGTLLNEFDKDAQKIMIKDVLYVPKLEGSLISVKKLAELGFEISFKGPTCTIKKGKLLVTANLDKQLYKLKYSHKSFMVRDASHDDCIHIWHRRFGHRDPTAIRRLEKEAMTKSLNISNCTQIKKCEECIKGKMTIKPFPKRSENHASEPYQILHSDVCGPMKTTSLSGKRYVATIIDDFSGYTEIFLLKTKNEVNQNLFEYFKKWNNFFQRKPTIIRTDGGGEYINQELNSYLKQKGIQRQISTPYTPQQNGTAERKNRYLMDMTRCMLLDANLSNTYWGEAINTAAYLQNRIPHRMQNKTPYELWYKRKPSIDHLRVFGCKAFTRTPSEKLTKLDDRAESGIMMGYSKFSKGYRILQPHTGKIIISRNVIFDESPYTTALAQNHQDTDQSHNDDNYEEKGEDSQPEVIIINPELQKLQEPGLKIEKETTPIPLRRSERTNKGIPAKRYACKGQVTSEYEPQKWSDIMSLNGTEKEKWLQAIEEEMKSFRDNDAWKLVTPPTGKNIVGCKWTFKIKYNSEGMVTQHKARLVAKGYSQKAGEDFTKTYAPVVRYSTIRALLVIISSRQMHTHHLDVKCAFLNGELLEELYMEQPEGQVTKGQEGMVCKLKRCIYGLKQSANAWNHRINEILTSKGYNRGTADQCLYTRKRDKAMTYILLYVDDLLICSDDENHITEMRQELEKLFKMKDLGTVTYYLGIHIQKQRDGSFLINQSNKLRSLASRFGLEDAKDASSPMESDYLKLKYDQNLLPNQDQYREAVGALMYISTVTRPDIAAAANFLGRKVAQPNQADWTAVKRVIRYLKSTAEMGIILGGEKSMTLIGYVDADWAGDCQDRKSTSGFTFHLGNSLITWSSRKQSCVAMSSTEAEYVAAAAACQEIKWLKQLLMDFNYPQKGPITLFEDNQGCIKLASSDGFHARTKHIDVKYHILKHFQDQQIINLEYCPTNMMLADMFTKPLVRDRFLELREKLRVMTPIC